MQKPKHFKQLRDNVNQMLKRRSKWNKMRSENEFTEDIKFLLRSSQPIEKIQRPVTAEGDSNPKWGSLWSLQIYSAQKS